MNDADILAELAPTGTLRAAINLGNTLLVTGRTPSGDPAGVAPSMAQAIAERLGVPLALVPYERPGVLADAVDDGAWDIGLIAVEPARAEKIAFTSGYVEIEATYLVPAGSAIRDIADIDQKGVRISVSARSAYDLWLQRNIKQASIVPAPNIPASVECFQADELEALAGLRTLLLEAAERMPGARILEGNFATVQQAIGTASAHRAGAAFLEAFVEEARTSGLVARLIDQFGATGLSVPNTRPG